MKDYEGFPGLMSITQLGSYITHLTIVRFLVVAFIVGVSLSTVWAAETASLKAEHFNLTASIREVEIPPTWEKTWGSKTLKYREFSLPVSDSVPAILDIAADGSVWFVAGGGGFAGIPFPSLSYIGKIDASGRLTLYELPTKSAVPSGIKAGKDGHVYVTEYFGNKIADLDTINGTIREFLLPTAQARPTALEIDSNGTVWFNENGASKLGKLTAKGHVTEEVIPTPQSRPTGMTMGKGGEIWLAEMNTDRIAERRPDGVIIEYVLPTLGSKPTAMTKDKAGNIWVSERAADKIAKLSNGGFTEYSLPHNRSGPFFLVQGPDDAIWFTEIFGNRVGRLNVDTGTIEELDLPTEGGWPGGIGFDRSNNLWITLQMKNKICFLGP